MTIDIFDWATELTHLRGVEFGEAIRSAIKTADRCRHVIVAEYAVVTDANDKPHYEVRYYVVPREIDVSDVEDDEPEASNEGET